MQTLLDGPFALAAMQADLSAFEALLNDALVGDPSLGGDTVAEHFDGFEEYLTDRHASVLGQLP